MEVLCRQDKEQRFKKKILKPITKLDTVIHKLKNALFPYSRAIRHCDFHESGVKSLQILMSRCRVARLGDKSRVVLPEWPL